METNTNTTIMTTTKEMKQTLKSLGINKVGVFNTTSKKSFKIYRISKDGSEKFTGEEVNKIQNYVTSVNGVDIINEPIEFVGSTGVEFYIK